MTPKFPPQLLVKAEEYLTLLARWNAIHSLTALPEQVRFEELVLDSAALLPLLAHLPTASRLVDFGSGTGAPAIPLAILRPDLHILAIDRSSKKAAFIRQASLELGLANLEVVQGDIEILAPLQAAAGCAKALGSLSILTRWWSRHGEAQAPMFAFKGPGWSSEAMPEGWLADPIPYRLPTRGERVILRLTERLRPGASAPI